MNNDLYYNKIITFCFFFIYIKWKIKKQKNKIRKNAQRGGRTHNLEIKSLTLYRLS